MATTSKAAPKRKPAAKKTTAKRATTRRTTPRKTVVSPEEKHEKVTAYYTLQQAGVPVPADLKKEVEGWIRELRQEQDVNTPADHSARATDTGFMEPEVVPVPERTEEDRETMKAPKPVEGPWHVRNMTYSMFNCRLESQTERKRIQLKPRGQAGDMCPLKDEDLADAGLRSNVGMGICEVIPAAEAYAIQNQQTQNMGKRVHAPLALLRNELGQEYAQDSLKIEAEFNSQGVTVATLDPRAMQGHLTDKEINRSIQRVSEDGQPQQPMIPGPPERVQSYVPTGGHNAIIQYGPQQNIDAQIQRDISNRTVKEQNLHRGPNELTVTVDPLQKN